MNLTSNHDNVIFIGNLPIGKALFLKLENAFLLSNKDDILEIVSTSEHIELELMSWCKLKGYIFLDKTILKQQYCYRIHNPKPSHYRRSSEKTLLPQAPDDHGLMARDTLIESGSTHYNFGLDHKEQLWAEPAGKLYEESKKQQWNATTDIAWNDIPDYDPKFEQHICQIMTYLIENEFSALYIPGQFISQMNPYYMEIPLFLGSLMNDEARHIEVFTKRANANGQGMQFSSAVTQRSLYSLLREKDYVTSSFLLHVMGEGTFIDLLKFLEQYMPDESTKKILQYVRKDESRHVAYGMAHMKSVLEQNPKKIHALKETTFKRKAYMDELNAESTLLIESMSMLAGGNLSVAGYKHGFEAVEQLKKKMNVNRIKRLVEIGIDEDLAHDISQVHTPNFM